MKAVQDQSLQLLLQMEVPSAYRLGKAFSVGALASLLTEVPSRLQVWLRVAPSNARMSAAEFARTKMRLGLR